MNLAFRSTKSESVHLIWLHVFLSVCFISAPLGMISAKIKSYYLRIKDGYNTCGSLSCTQ